MNSDNNQLYNQCIEEPSLVFNLIKNNKFEVVNKLIENNKININLEDSVGNNVVMRLLKAKQYDMVISLIKKRNFDVNHQNEDGNTIGHILVKDESLYIIKVLEQLLKKKNYKPNIKNKKGETVIDRAINNNHLCIVFKILEDKRFNNIDLDLFKTIYDVCIRNTYYGKYSKLNNLEIIVESLERKELIPSIKKIVEEIKQNFETIKREIMNNKIYLLEAIVNNKTA